MNRLERFKRWFFGVEKELPKCSELRAREEVLQWKKKQLRALIARTPAFDTVKGAENVER